MRRLLLQEVWVLLRRRSCSRPLLLLLGLALCLFYQTLVLARNRFRSGPQAPVEPRSRRPAGVAETEETRRLVSSLEGLHTHAQVRPPLPRAVLLTGRLPASDPQLQLVQRVLQQLQYQVHQSRYAETSNLLRGHQGVSGWSLLLCLNSSERSCLRRISFTHLQRHQMVNLLPAVTEAFSDAGEGMCNFLTRSHLTEADLPMRPHSCGSTNQKLPLPPASGADRRSPVEAPPSALVATVNVYILVTSVNPLISFMHDIIVVTTNQEQRGRVTQLDFLLQQLGPEVSHEALGQVKQAVGQVLQAATTNQKQDSSHRCVLCFQLLTFTLVLSRLTSPVVVQVDSDLTFSALSDDSFDRQINKDLILEDTLHFLLSSHTHLSSETHTHLSSETHTHLSSETHTHLSDDQLLLLFHFQRQVKASSSFQLLYPSTSCCCSSCCSSSSSSSSPLTDLLVRISCFYELQRKNISRVDETEESTNQDAGGVCVDPRLRQIYTDPPLLLSPPFDPRVREYRAEVSFDTVTVRIRPEPASSACRVHLDEHQGPRMVNYPLGLGDSRIVVLVTDASEPEPVVMAIYTVKVYRESRPSLPMFGDHVTCSFLQDCGLVVQPSLPCGLQPYSRAQSPLKTCTSGHEPGRWAVPCLSCSDYRTCDWREVAWQPDGCYHRMVEPPLLRDCMTDRKVLFVGDSTNRGMMYFLMERLNRTLVDWMKSHDTQVFQQLNGGRTLVSFSYYPRFWLEKKLRPSFRQTLLQLIHRSRPLVNSHLTVLVVGGVQWLNRDHLRTVREVLHSEALSDVLVVVKSLGMGFHLPVDGIRSLSLAEVQQLHGDNSDIIATAKHYGYEAIDTFSITMGRYKEFLQGRCACHFHQVDKFWSDTSANRTVISQSEEPERGAGPKASSYHVRGEVNQVYSEILLSRLCPRTRD